MVLIMISEKLVIQYLKNKNQEYINNLLNRITNSHQHSDHSKDTCSIC